MMLELLETDPAFKSEVVSIVGPQDEVVVPQPEAIAVAPPPSKLPIDVDGLLASEFQGAAISHWQTTDMVGIDGG